MTTQAPAQRVEHAAFCTDPDRTETFRAERYGHDGITVVGRPRVTRCLTCGEQVVQG